MNLIWRYGMCLYEDGRWNEAEAAITDVLEIEKRGLGTDHPDTLTSINNLALTWKGQGRDKEALKLIEECITLRSRIIGTNYPYTLSSRIVLLGWQIEGLNIGTSVGRDLDV
jgi:hypothetical protein